MYTFLDFFFVCLFMVFRPTREFFTDMETSPFPAANFDLRSANVAIEQWGASVYNDHLRGLVTLTPIAERLAVRLSLPVFTSWVGCGWDSNTQSSVCGSNARTLCVTTATQISLIYFTSTVYMWNSKAYDLGLF